jgi:hypothetical protein
MQRTMPKKSKKPGEKSVIYVEAPLWLKQRMEALAEKHERRLTGEVIVALKEYVAREEAKEEGGAK